MRCPKCQHENSTDAKFCMECGAKLENLCYKCGAKLPLSAKFCPECGAKIDEATSDSPKAIIPTFGDAYDKILRNIPKSMAEKLQPTTSAIEGENRAISILFGDVKGSVILAEKMPPEDFADLINECVSVMVDVIWKYEGSVNRYPGDCVLAFFGTPTAHENDPERAIFAALEMREAVANLNLRLSIGINTGMVYVGAIGPDGHRETTAMGSAVNLASRLQSAASEQQSGETGLILVGESTYRLTHRSYEFRELPPMKLKNIETPVTAYEVIKPLPKPEKIRGIDGLRSEMIGRDNEFTDLKDSVDELLAGHGQIVSIIGEAGVGKSRLVSELRGYLDVGTQHAVSLLEGRCVSIGESIGYWVFVDILRSYMGFSDEDSPVEIREKIIDKMQAVFPQRWKDIIPYIGNLLSVRFEDELYEKMRHLPPEQIKHQTFMTLRDLFFTLSQQKPLILIFEDLHWADDLSLDMINLLMDVLTLSPLMLICVYRPEKEHKSWHIGTRASGKCLDRYREIMLRALNPYESRRLIESLLAIDKLPESVKQTITDKAGGNPFFVEEVIRSLMERGVVYQDGEKWIAKEDVNDINVPDTIQSVIMARIDRLEEDVKSVLQSASVIGRLFRYNLLRYITQQEGNLDDYLWQLEERNLVYEEHAIPELEYSFRHVLTQETAYNNILSRRKREFHRKVAEGYETLYSSRIEEYYEELAYHYGRSDDKNKALDYLVKAGDKSVENFANDQAILYYNQALKLIDEIDGSEQTLRGHIYQSLADIYFTILKYDESLECCQKALEYTIDKRKRAKIYQIIAGVYEKTGKLDLAKEHINKAIAELGDDAESPEMAQICITYAWILFGVAIRSLKRDERDTKEAEEIALCGLKIVEGTSHYSEIVDLYTCLLFMSEYSYLNIDKTFEYAEKAMEIAKKSGNSLLIANSLFWLGWAYLRANVFHSQEGGYDIALKYFKESLEIYERIGNNWGIGMSYYHIWIVYNGKGSGHEAIQWLERSLRFPEHTYYSFFAFHLAQTYLQNGNMEKSIEICKRLLEYLQDSDAQDKAMAGFSLMRRPISVIIGAILNIMEDALVNLGKRDEFIPYCKKLIEKKPQDLKLTQWYLEPAELSGLFTETVLMDDFNKSDLRTEWEWVDPNGKSSYTIESGWLQLDVDFESDLYDPNFTPPRLLREMSGDFAIEIKMKSASDDLPSGGGLIIWKDEKNYIRFEKRYNTVDLTGSVNEDFNCFGRGSLCSELLYLRLERIGGNIRAYCSNDGEKWLKAGEVVFPIEDPIQIGIHALGSSDGKTATSTRFDYFRVLK